MPTDYRETLGKFQIHMKDGRERFLVEVGKTYASMYPARADFFKRGLRQLREVTTDGYQAGKAGHMYVKVRVPTELMLFIQQWVPGFGDDSKDIELLCKVWCDLVPAGKDFRRRTRLIVKDNYTRVQKSRTRSEAPAREAGQESTASVDQGPPVRRDDADRPTVPIPAPCNGRRGEPGPEAGVGGDDCEELRGVAQEDAPVPSRPVHPA